MDIEIAEHQAVREQFPNAMLRGCLFHWKQFLIRRFQTVPSYRNNTTVKETLHSFFGLTFVLEIQS